MKAEYDSIMQNNTWELVDRLKKHKVIGTKWVYKLKFRFNGSLEKHKARLVVKMYAQAEGLDYDETFAPTAQMVTIMTMNFHGCSLQVADLSDGCEVNIF